MYRVQFQVRENREWISAPYKSTVFDKYEDALTYFNRQIKTFVKWNWRILLNEDVILSKDSIPELIITIPNLEHQVFTGKSVIEI